MEVKLLCTNSNDIYEFKQEQRDAFKERIKKLEDTINSDKELINFFTYAKFDSIKIDNEVIFVKKKVSSYNKESKQITIYIMGEL